MSEKFGSKCEKKNVPHVTSVMSLKTKFPPPRYTSHVFIEYSQKPLFTRHIVNFQAFFNYYKI